MTDEISTQQNFLFSDQPLPGIYEGNTPPQDCLFPQTQFKQSSPKRQVLFRCCSRLAASGLSGADIAVEYLYGKYIKNLSVHTIRQSGHVVLSFLRFLSNDNTDIYTLTRQNICFFVEYQQDRGLKTLSVIGYLRALYAFITFLAEQEILPHTIMQNKIRIKQPDSLPRAISSEDIQILIETISNVRDRALILLLLRTGMRIGELLNVKVNDISFSERKILIYLGEKNYQGRAVYYSEDADLAIQSWMEIRNQGSEYLFAGRKGNHLSYSTAWGVMRTILKNAGLSHKSYSLHSLRHTFATDMLNAGMPLEVLQQLLGHQEIEMTILYTRIADRTREHEYFKAMDTIEHGRHHEPHRINDQLQKVFEEKKLIRSHGKKLSK